MSNGTLSYTESLASLPGRGLSDFSLKLTYNSDSSWLNESFIDVHYTSAGSAHAYCTLSTVRRNARYSIAAGWSLDLPYVHYGAINIPG